MFPVNLTAIGVLKVWVSPFLYPINPIHHYGVYLYPVGSVTVSFGELPMEYLVLRNGGVLPVEPVAGAATVLVLFDKHDAVALYWRVNNYAKQWYVMTYEDGLKGGNMTNNVPEVVLLAQMLV